jgi:hypothetical protein
MEWIRPPQELSAEPGMHRFVWDLHYPPPDVLETEYPISAIYHDTPRHPLGPSLLPGKYSVKLTVSGRTYTQPLTIKMDPRVKTSQDGLRQQFELETRICDAMSADYKAIQEVRSVRAQLKKLNVPAKQAPLTEAVASLEKKAAELEGGSGGFGAAFLQDAAGRSLARLNTALTQLLNNVDGADAAPTTQALGMFGAVQTALEAQLAAWKSIQAGDIPRLNAQLRKAKLEEIRATVAPGQDRPTPETTQVDLD